MLAAVGADSDVHDRRRHTRGNCFHGPVERGEGGNGAFVQRRSPQQGRGMHVLVPGQPGTACYQGDGSKRCRPVYD